MKVKNMIENRKFFFFEWIVIDRCNLSCSYCVTKGGNSQKAYRDVKYVKGREIDIARKIVELSKRTERVFVNLTGGEPLLLSNFPEVLSILASAENITLSMVTNLKLIGKCANDIEHIFPAMNIGGSLHVHYRTYEEIECIISFLNNYKDRLHFNLSQVDYNLTNEEKGTIARIEAQTGYKVDLQPFIPPYSRDFRVENENEILDTNFVTSLGKRCGLGYSYFLVHPDGSFWFDLWCNDDTRKIGNFLDITAANFNAYILEGMKQCPKKQCGCNYNTFHHAEYLADCTSLAYPDEEIFGPNNRKLEKKVFSSYEDELRNLNARIYALETSFSWRITSPLRYLCDLLRNN